MIDARKEFLKEKKIRRSKNYIIKSSRWLLIQLLAKKYNTVSISEIINIVSYSAFYFTLLIFTFPVALPLPYPPGLPSLCGIPILLLSVQMICNSKTIILPKFIKNYRIKVSLIKTIILKSQKIFKFISKVIKVGRMEFLINKYFKLYYSIFSTILALCIIIPFPATNFLPAVAIFLLCCGILFKDGLLILISLIVGKIGILIVYFATAYFAAIATKIAKTTYNKLANIYFSEVAIAFTIGLLVGIIGMLFITLFIELLFKKIKNKNDNRLK